MNGYSAWELEVVQRLTRIEETGKSVDERLKRVESDHARLESVEVSIGRAKGALSILYVLFVAMIGAMWRKLFGS